MHLANFDFALPRELIAGRPAEPREAARLLVLPATGGLGDRRIADLPELVRPGDLLVFNDTKVIPARLVGSRGLATVEITLARDLGGGVWSVYAKGARRLRPGDRIDFAADFSAGVVDKSPDGAVMLRFDREGEAFRTALLRYGAMPLPPYIRRPQGGDPRDRGDYQTIFARAEIAARGAEWATVTLHVGPGTFLPVKEEDPREHKMHAEWGIVGAEAASRINEARGRGGRIIAVGTTSLRLLESAAAETGAVAEFCGE